MEGSMKKYALAGSALLTAALLTACSQGSSSVLQPYTFADGTSELSADVGKSRRLESYAGSQTVLLDDSAYPVEQVTAEEALLFALDEDYTVILCKNAYGTFQPGNMTKLIAGEYILSHYDVYDEVLIDSNIFSVDSSLWSCHFTKNDSVKMKDLLYAAVMYGANDVMIPLSIYTVGDMKYLTEELNTYMAELGAENTSFVNCYGTEVSGQQTTIYDLYMFLRKALENTDFVTMLETKTYSCQYSNGDNKNGMTLTNALPYFVQGVTSASGFNIVGGVCESETVNPTQMLTIAEDADGLRYVAFVAGCDGYADCLAQTEEILSRIGD
jgi:D-alanyl-D-alanine carboxypeptidase